SDVMAEVARLSHGPRSHDDGARGLAGSATRIATCTVAESVRRTLADVGFETARAAGFGGKGEMLRGVYRPAAEPVSRLSPWFARPAARPRSRGHAAIIGAGVAGCAMAGAMIRRGWSVTLIDQHADVAKEASGNPIGVLM